MSTKGATLNAYHALFESHARRYKMSVWGGSSQSNLDRALPIQKRALRVMAGAGWRVSRRQIFVEWELLTVINLHVPEVVLISATRNLPRNEGYHHYDTRYARKYDLPAHHLCQFDLLFFVTVLLLNQLVPFVYCLHVEYIQSYHCVAAVIIFTQTRYLLYIALIFK